MGPSSFLHRREAHKVTMLRIVLVLALAYVAVVLASPATFQEEDDLNSIPEQMKRSTEMRDSSSTSASAECPTSTRPSSHGASGAGASAHGVPVVSSASQH